ncbi:hypothetical protein [Agromyces neolithicus]|uniref:Uncharacterized protein n=1 Tax=Agromyces neolithicus TaxID=269420 RepID=A0ABN2MBI0_9MICO
MTPHVPHPITRRTALHLGFTAAGALGLMLLRPSPQAAGAMPPMTRPRTTGEAAADAALAARFRFACISPLPDFAPRGRLEEVWADPYYMTITDCTVSYIGEGPFVLTDEESAIVDVVSEHGGDVLDRNATYLVVLAASTRIDPARLHSRLVELGRPIVAASLALAPDAPQSELFAGWLAAPA